MVITISLQKQVLADNYNLSLTLQTKYVILIYKGQYIYSDIFVTLSAKNSLRLGENKNAFRRVGHTFSITLLNPVESAYILYLQRSV